MGSSIPAAVDYLVAAIRGLDEAQPPVAVSDGWPTTRSDTEIVIGIDTDDGETAVTGAYAELSREEYEGVEVPCVIAVHRAGQNASSRARTDAYALLDAVKALVASDRRFGGAIRPGMPARVVRWSMQQTSSAQQAGEGRVCVLTFVVGWQHRG